MAQTLLVFSQPVIATDARGGTNDDFKIESITLGNVSQTPSQWVNPDGSVIDYVVKGEPIGVEIEVARRGTGFLGNDVSVLFEIVHPIGYIIDSFAWVEVDMVPGSSRLHDIEWTPTVAHSILNTSTNELSGGILLRASVDYPIDDQNENDLMERSIPVALTQEAMDGDQNQNVDGFLAGRYPAEGGSAFGQGSWVEDSSSAAVGSGHWRHSNPGADYTNNVHDRIVLGYFTQQTNQCEPTHQLDSGLTGVYGVAAICKYKINSFNFVSMQIHAQAWGVMGAGDDYLAMELWRGNGAPSNSLMHNVTDDLPGTGAGQWSNISWDPSDQLNGYSWNVGFLFHSDSSGAAQGMHMDDFTVFGVEKVDDFTLDVDCNNQDSGFDTYPNNVVTLHCIVANNGYRNSLVRISSNVSNVTWMQPATPSIRIDSDNLNSHGTTVLLPPIKPGEPQEMWVNLSVPPGADVQQQQWSVWWTDAGGTNSGEKARLDMNLAVLSQYGVYLSSNVPTIAASIEPGGNSAIPFRMQNSGNREAGFTLSPIGLDQSWSAFVQDEMGDVVIGQIILSKGESVDLFLNVTTPDDASPGEVPFSLRASCPSCGTTLFGNSVITKKILVPIDREVALSSDNLDITVAANGEENRVFITVLNLGNDEGQYNFTVSQSSYSLQASLNTYSSTVLEPWYGEMNLILKLPMPIGLSPGLYTVTVSATSIDDSSIRDQLIINVDVVDTAAVRVLDAFPDQSFIPGDPAQSMEFNITNTGNLPDRFSMSLNTPEGMEARFEQLVDDRTVLIEPGESIDVIVRFNFLDGSDGQLTLFVTATSVNDANITDTGEATYVVGSQNWLRILSIERPIFEKDGDYEVSITVRNQYSSAQVVKMELDIGQSNSYFTTTIGREDLSFNLQVEEERTVVIYFDVPPSTMDNIVGEQFVTNITIWARSETVSDAASLSMEITLLSSETFGNPNDGISSSGDVDIFGIATWIFGIIFILVLGVILLRVITEVEEEEEAWIDDGYEEGITSTYGGVAAAPTFSSEKMIPDIASSTSAILSPPSSSPPVDSQVAPAAAPASAMATPVAAQVPVPSGPPPVPADGLPDGWTMEQWDVYGEQWLQSQSS
jgi:uncharacterized membrane protein